MFTVPSNLPDDPATLQLILRAALAEIERLQLQLAGLRRNRFGRRSEKLDDEQIERGFEDLEQSVAEQQAGLDAAAAEPSAPDPSAPEPKTAPASPRTKPAKRNRGALPAHLPRIEVIVDVEDKACPCCGGPTHVIGEDVAEMLDYAPAQVRVKVIRRPRRGCRACEGAVVQAPAPDRPSRLTALAWHQSAPISLSDGAALSRDARPDRWRHGDRGAARAHPGQQVWRLPAAVSPDPHLRPSGRGAGSFHLVRLGRPRLLVAGAAARVDVDRRAGLAENLRRRHDFAGVGPRPGENQNRTAVVLRRRQPPLVWAWPSGRRLYLQRRPQRRSSGGTSERLQRPASGRRLCRVRSPGHRSSRRCPSTRFLLGSCETKVYDVFIATKSPIAKEAVKRIAALYAIESGVRGEPAEERQRVRHEQSRPLVEAMHVWLTEQLGRIPGASTLAKAIRYALNHWNGLVLFLEDGRLELDTNTVERAIRPVTITRKNSLFAGNDNGGRHWAIIATLIQSAKLNGVEPLAWLTDVIERIVSGRTKRHELETLLPWHWKAAKEAEAAGTG